MKSLLSLKSVVLAISVLILVLAGLQHFEPFSSLTWFQELLKKPSNTAKQETPSKTREVVSEESVVIEVVEKSLPSVVTIAIEYTSSSGRRIEINPFDPFSPFREIPGEDRTVERNIGSGFIVSSDGIVITNKHVVLESEATYSVITNDKKEYAVENIYRDPLNDLAILKIKATDLKPLELGDSSKIKLGQMAIAIGTPLGEFQNTITTGIVSGLGRGITAGSPYEGFIERLDSVIQTDAAISPGNSGGPLLNSSGQVVGINTAVASEGQNIGFAIPSNVIKELLDIFESRGGSFERPYLGVRYVMLPEEDAKREDLVEGALVESVVSDSPADDAGIKADDIITAIEGKKLDGDDTQSLAEAIVRRTIGDRITVKIWRDGSTKDLILTLEAYKE